MNKAILKKAISLYNSGLNTIEVGKTLGIPQPTIWYWLNEAGVKCRKNGFRKDHIPWNKGKKGLQTSWNKGKSMPLEQRKRQSETRKRLFAEGKLVPWNKNKKTPQETRKKQSEIKKKQIKEGTYTPPKLPVFHGSNHPQWKGGLPKCKHCGKQLTRMDFKCCRDCFWKYESKDVYSRRPTKPEKIVKRFLDKHFPKEWKYVGNGDFWLGRKNPDFMNVNGEKKLIEVFGDYWHKGETGEKRQKHFAKYGFKTLIIWENECYKGDKYLYKKFNNLK